MMTMCDGIAYVGGIMELVVIYSYSQLQLKKSAIVFCYIVPNNVFQ